MGGGGSNLGDIVDENGNKLDPKSEEYKRVKEMRMKKIAEEKAELEKKNKEEKMKLDQSLKEQKLAADKEANE